MSAEKQHNKTITICWGRGQLSLFITALCGERTLIKDMSQTTEMCFEPGCQRKRKGYTAVMYS